MALIGHLPEFQINDEWIHFRERLEQFFVANSVKPAKKASILITVLAPNVYKTLRDLCDPILPKDKTYEEICNILADRYTKTVAVFSERKKFYAACQNTEENISEWFERIKSLAVNCKFGTNLELILLDKFVIGMSEGRILERMYEEDPTQIKLEKLVDIALKKESFTKTSVSNVFLLTRDNSKDNTDSRQKSSNKSCYFCGKSNHCFKNCVARNYKCRNCSQIGHTAEVCKIKNNKFVEAAKEDDLSFFNFQVDKSGPLLYKIKVNDVLLDFEIDTGAAVSAISFETYKRHFSNVPLNKTSIILRLYNGRQIRPEGCIKVTVGELQDIPLLVILNGGPPLLGRDLFRKFKMSIMDDGTSSINNLEYNTAEQEIQKLIMEFQDIFKDELGEFKYEKIALRVKEGTKPIFCKPRKLPVVYKTKVEEELIRLEEAGVIKHVTNSEWGTPLVPVLKKDGSLRLCADYRITVNKHLEDFKYPLPRIEELFTALQGGEKFTKLDLSQAYNQLVLDDSSKLLLAWSTHKGIFAMQRLPFGTKPACAIFQAVLEKTLQGIPGVANFLDDIIVTGKDVKEHLKNLRLVFEKLSEAGFRIKIEKCKFMESEVAYLGYIINSAGLKKDFNKVKAIMDAPRPTNVTQVKSFAGMINYYGRFIPKLAEIMNPLYELLRKDKQFIWGKTQERAFQEAKKVMVSDTILVHFDPTLPIRLSCDASQNGIGAILSHVFPDGVERPISFASRVFMAAERNYSVLDKEALAIYYGVKKFAQYLTGLKFTLLSDHKPLVFLFGSNKGIPQMAASRMQRWSVYLNSFDFDIQYIKGELNCGADCLSRLPIMVNYIIGRDDSYLNFIENKLPVDYKLVKKETAVDPILSKIINWIKLGWPNHIIEEEIKPYFRRRLELTVEQDVIMWGHRIIIPMMLHKELLLSLHTTHSGMSKMKSKARAYFWWPGLDKDIEKLVSGCNICVAARPDPPQARLIPYQEPEGCFQRIHIDFFGPCRKRMFLVVLDAFSKWPEVVEMPSITTSQTLDKLKDIFARFGLPKKIVSDNGAQLTSLEFEHFCVNNGIKHVTIPPFHPASNGAAENAVKSIKCALIKALNDNNNFHYTINAILAKYLFNYRSTKHSTTGETPAYRMFGREMRTQLDLLLPDKEYIKVWNNHSDSKDLKKREIFFSVGDEVYVRDYRTVNKKSWVPAIITEVLGPRVYNCGVKGTSLIWRRHLDQIIKPR